MPAVKIPGPDDIQNVGVARDPGVQASASDFGGQVGAEINKFGDVLASIGYKLHRERQQAEDQTFLDTVSLRGNLAAAQDFYATQQDRPGGGPDIEKAFADRFDKTSGTLLDDLTTNGQFSPSGAAIEKARHQLAAIHADYGIKAVTWGHNERIKMLGQQLDQNADATAASALANPGDVDAILGRLDQTFDAQKAILPADVVAEKRDNARKTTVAAAIQGYISAGDLTSAKALRDKYFGAVPDVGIPGSAGLPAVIQAIHGQESGGRATSATSVDGAVGGFQITPDTFRRYAKPGENINTSADNAAVGQRILAHYYQEYNGDPARVAVAYFSGEGNVAPEAFATPWKKDARDGNGKSVSSYVSDVLHRLGRTGPAAAAGGREAPLMPDAGMALKFDGVFAKAQAQDSTAVADQYNRAIIDAKANLGPLPDRSTIENDPRLDDGRRNTLLTSYDEANKTVVATQGALTKFADPHAHFNPFDEGDQKAADLVFKSLGGTPDALQEVVSRTGMVPKTAGSVLRAMTVTANPQEAARGMQMAADLMQRNPHIFAGIPGADDIEKAAVTFRHYTDDLGFSTEEAARQVQTLSSPEYQAKVKGLVGTGQDVDKVVKSSLSPSDLSSAFNPGLPFIGRPEVGGNPQAKQYLMQDYEELFRTNYIQTGDVGTSKALAIGQLKKVWGVTNVTGTPTITRYPPENAPAYAGIADASDKIAAQAVQDVQNWIYKHRPPQEVQDMPVDLGGGGEPAAPGTEAAGLGIPQAGVVAAPASAEVTANETAALVSGGIVEAQQRELASLPKIDRSHILLTPLPGGQTAQAYKAGRPVPYQISWVDKRGLLHAIPAAYSFTPDPKQMVEEQTSERAAAFRATKAANEASVAEGKRIATEPNTFRALGSPSPSPTISAGQP